MKISIPGVGGSLGECPVCGDTFLREILLGESIPGMQVKGIGANLYVHKSCAKTVEAIKDGDWKKLPDGPLRKEFEETDERMKTAQQLPEP